MKVWWASSKQHCGMSREIIVDKLGSIRLNVVLSIFIRGDK